MELTFKDRTFSGEDPILIFDDLTRFVEEANKLDNSEGHLFVLLPHILSVSASDQYPAASDGSQSGRTSGIVHWSESVQYLLGTHATEEAMGEAIDETIDDFLHVRQDDNQT